MNADQGFTLLELLVTIALTSIIVIYLTQLYKLTGHTVTALKTAGSDWNAEHFMRQQLWQQLAEFNGGLRQFKGEKNLLQFATQYSAASGNSGSYVKAIYRYDSGKQTLEYQEHSYINWWTAEGREKIKTNTLSQKESVQIVFKQINNLHFSYSYRSADGTTKWKETWDNPKQLPELIKLDYQRGGQLQTLILDHQVLSFSTVSGF